MHENDPSRFLKRPTLFVAIVLVLGPTGCRSPDGDDELRALLHDAPLSHRTDPSGGSAAADGPTALAISSSTLGQWSFDDCNPIRTNLLDSSFQGNTAFRAVT